MTDYNELIDQYDGFEYLGVDDEIWEQLKRESAKGRVITTSQYWECECVDDYVKPFWLAYCHECSMNKDDAPSARVTDVIKYNLEIWANWINW